MHRGALDSNVAALHPHRIPLFQHHLNLAFQNDPIVQTLRAVNNRVVPRGEVHNATDGAAGVDETKPARLLDLLVRCHVAVVVQVWGELGGCVDDVEGQVALFECFPLTRRGGVDDGLARRRIVAGDVPHHWPQRGDLTGIGGGHDGCS